MGIQKELHWTALKKGTMMVIKAHTVYTEERTLFEAGKMSSKGPLVQKSHWYFKHIQMGLIDNVFWVCVYVWTCVRGVFMDDHLECSDSS